MIARVERTNWRERERGGRAMRIASEHTASRRFVGLLALGPSAARTTAWLMTNTHVSLVLHLSNTRESRYFVGLGTAGKGTKYLLGTSSLFPYLRLAQYLSPPGTEEHIVLAYVSQSLIHHTLRTTIPSTLDHHGH